MSSTESTAERLVSLEDHIELSRLLVEHAYRADNGRGDTIHELYMENGELILPSGTIHGREALTEWGRRLVTNRPWRTIRHVCGNMRFVATGPDSAEGVAVLTVFRVAGDEPATTVPFRVGEEHDRFARTPDGWRYVSRRWVERFPHDDGLDPPK